VEAKLKLGGIGCIWMADLPPDFTVIGLASSTDLFIGEVACVYCFVCEVASAYVAIAVS